MKSRLSSTIWTLVFVNGLALFIVLGLAYHAAGVAASLFDSSAAERCGRGEVEQRALLTPAVRDTPAPAR